MTWSATGAQTSTDALSRARRSPNEIPELTIRSGRNRPALVPAAYISGCTGLPATKLTIHHLSLAFERLLPARIGSDHLPQAAPRLRRWFAHKAFAATLASALAAAEKQDFLAATEADLAE
jgi:hypothetical protein